MKKENFPCQLRAQRRENCTYLANFASSMLSSLDNWLSLSTNAAFSRFCASLSSKFRIAYSYLAFNCQISVNCQCMLESSAPMHYLQHQAAICVCYTLKMFSIYMVDCCLQFITKRFQVFVTLKMLPQLLIDLTDISCNALNIGNVLRVVEIFKVILVYTLLTWFR